MAEQTTKFSTVLIIGAGESGICAGVQLKRQLGFTDFTIYERHSDLGGTWYANSYPGCACDVPAVMYSFSFAQNAAWTQFYPSASELHAYLTQVCTDYRLQEHMVFNTECESAVFDADRSIWVLKFRKRAVAEWEVKMGKKGTENLRGGVIKIEREPQPGDTWIHECKVLLSAVGGLVEPKMVKLKDQDKFEGAVFHSGVWDHSVDYTDKNVVLLGNGCSALQIIPTIAPKVKSITQIVRSAHWILQRPPPPLGGLHSRYAKSVFKYIPGVLTAFRLLAFAVVENTWSMFKQDSKRGAQMRNDQARASINYIKKNAPEMYWKLLIPEFEVGCKRRIFDVDYVPSLHRENVHLTRDDVSHLTSNSVVTIAGEEYPADLIVQATGYQTNEWIAPLDVIGRNGERLTDHWKKMGGPAAYNSTSVEGFPNFFMVFGPNSATGHSSVILASENMVNYCLKLIKPILKGEVKEVEVKRDAELSYSRWIQDALSKTVWAGACKSWYVSATGWNSTTYPFSQIHFTFRSTFPDYKDWNIVKTPYGVTMGRLRRALVFAVLFGIGWLALLFRRGKWNLDDAKKLVGLGKT